MANLQVGDVGTELILTVYRADGSIESQLGSATILRIILQPPSGAANAKVKTATLVTDGSDGQMKYTTEAGVIDEAGPWEMNGYIYFDATHYWWTSKRVFYVKENPGGQGVELT